MRNIVVNAVKTFGIVARPGMAVPSVSPPNKNNNIGGTRGRAAFILRGDAARAAEAHVLLHAVTMLGLTLLLFVMSAPDLWPRLFP